MSRRIGPFLAAVVVALGLAGCGTETDGTASSEGRDGSAAENTLRITEREYAFETSGEPVAGSLTIEVENAGAELHEIAMAKLLDGKTPEDAKAALDAATEETENVLEGIAEEDSAIDDLGSVQAPGSGYAITGPDVPAGEYLLMCFIPNAEGVPHYKLGMFGSFSIGEGSDTDSPDGMVTYTASDERLDGPKEVPAGETAITVVNDTEVSREVSLLKLAAGKTMEDAGAFFEQADQGPPDFSKSPFEFFTFAFDSESDRTLIVPLTPGQWGIQTSDPEKPFEGSPAEDPHAVFFTVT